MIKKNEYAPQPVRKEWARPEVNRLEAGAAEASASGPTADGAGLPNARS